MNISLMRRAATLIESHGPLSEDELWSLLNSRDKRAATFYDLHQWALTSGRIKRSIVTKKWMKVGEVAELRTAREFRPLVHDVRAHQRLCEECRA